MGKITNEPVSIKGIELNPEGVVMHFTQENLEALIASVRKQDLETIQRLEAEITQLKTGNRRLT